MKPDRQSKARLHDEIEALRQRVADLEGGLAESGPPERFRSTLDSLLEGCQIIARDWTYLYLNDAAARQGRRPKEELIGRTMMECFPGIELTPLFASLERCMRDGTSDEIENEFRYPDGSVGWFELRVEPVPDGLFILSLDITRREHDEAQIKRLNRTYALLSATNHAIVHIRDLRQLLQRVCSIAVDTGGYRTSWIGMIEDATRELRVIASAGATQTLLDRLDLTQLDDPGLSTTPLGRAWIAGEPAFDIIPEQAASPGSRQKVERELGFRSSAAFPLIVFGKARWMLALYSDDGAAFDGAEVKLLEELAADLAFAMELAEKEDQRTRAEAEVEVLSRFAAENPNPVLRAERNGGLLYANDAALALLPGWELMVGRPLPTAVSQAVRQAIDTEVGRVIEVQLGHRTFSVFIAPVEEAGYAILYAFDITELRDRDVSLRKLGERFQSTFEQAAVGMAHVAPDNRLLRVNRRLCEILGYSHGELLERGLQDITHPDEVERDRLSMEHLLSGARRSYSVEKRYIRKDGSAIWANLTTSLAQAADGKPAYFISVIEDISERKQGEEEIRRLNAELEERVTLRTAQLQSANEELEAFSYSVSHDLRAPLRGIDGWSLALLEDYGDQLDVQAREYLGRVRAETQRMGELIDDLLQLSRVSRAQMQHGPIDLTDLAERVIARLREAQPERRIEVAVEPGLAALGDPRLLEVVLTNLLDNAWKFTRATPNPTIEVGRMEVNATHAFYVRDNGAGFDMVFADKLFGVFQRLHKPSEFPGTGVGLATIQRIIRRHGGEVWADSQTGQGATFYFTLPEVE